MTIDEIYQNLANDFLKKTGLSVSGNSELAVRFYAVAAQLSGLYSQIEWANRQCFPQTASGEQLDHHAATRGIKRKEPATAVGTVRFFAGDHRMEASVIPAGTVCMTAEGLRYITTAEGTIAMDASWVDLPVEAVETGTSYNVAAGRVIYLAVLPSGIIACTNQQAMTGGQDKEDDESLRQRVLASYNRLSNGANAAFYQQAAMSFDGVAAVTVLPRNRGTGTVDVVVAALGGIPDDTMLDEIQSYFQQVREIAVDVQVSAPTTKQVDISLALSVKNGYTFEAVSHAVRSALENWFTGKLLGCPVLQAELTALVFHVDGVSNCTVTIPGGDVSADSITLPRPGTISITED